MYVFAGPFAEGSSYMIFACPFAEGSNCMNFAGPFAEQRMLIAFTFKSMVSNFGA